MRGAADPTRARARRALRRGVRDGHCGLRRRATSGRHRIRGARRPRIRRTRGAIVSRSVRLLIIVAVGAVAGIAAELIDPGEQSAGSRDPCRRAGDRRAVRAPTRRSSTAPTVLRGRRRPGAGASPLEFVAVVVCRTQSLSSCERSLGTSFGGRSCSPSAWRRRSPQAWPIAPSSISQRAHRTAGPFSPRSPPPRSHRSW